MKLDFSEISKGFDSALLKVAQNDMVSGDEALRILSRIQPTPENREAIERFKAYAATNAIPRSMLENTVNQLDPYIQKNMQVAAENKARTAAQKSLIQRSNGTPALPRPAPTANTPRPAAPAMAEGLPAAATGWKPGDATPPPSAPSNWAPWRWHHGIMNYARETSDSLDIAAQYRADSKKLSDETLAAQEYYNRLGQPEKAKQIADEYKQKSLHLFNQKQEALSHVPTMSKMRQANTNLELAAAKADEYHKLTGQKLDPNSNISNQQNYTPTGNPYLDQRMANVSGSLPKRVPEGVQMPNRQPAQPAPAQPAPAPMAPGLPAASTAPQGQQKNVSPIQAIKNKLNGPDKWYYGLPLVGDRLRDLNSAERGGNGFKKMFGISDSKQLHQQAVDFENDPWGFLGSKFKNFANNNKLLVGGGGLLLGGLALNSLFGKKKERQFGPPQGGGQNININLGGGAAPGMFGYHRAGVTSLGAPTGLTSNYGMDNKFGMDMVKHAGLVSTALGNVVKNRMANQAVDSLLHTTSKEERSSPQPSQEEIEIAVKNPEVLKLLENEQNKAYLNRLLSEK